MNTRKVLPLILLITVLAAQACDLPIQFLPDPEGDLDFDLSDHGDPDFEDDDPDFAGLGFTWEEEMPGGGVMFIGTLGTCNIPGPWDVWLVVSGSLGPENYLHIEGQTTVNIPQVGDDQYSGEFEVPMSGSLTDPDCVITYDLIMEMSVEITPYSLEIVRAVAGSQAIQASCPGLGTGYDPPPLTFPTDFVVAPMVGSFKCDGE
jgi:hypothetical protein